MAPSSFQLPPPQGQIRIEEQSSNAEIRNQCPTNAKLLRANASSCEIHSICVFWEPAWFLPCTTSCCFLMSSFGRICKVSQQRRKRVSGTPKKETTLGLNYFSKVQWMRRSFRTKPRPEVVTEKCAFPTINYLTCHILLVADNGSRMRGPYSYILGG